MISFYKGTYFVEQFSVIFSPPFHRGSIGIRIVIELWPCLLHPAVTFCVLSCALLSTHNQTLLIDDNTPIHNLHLRGQGRCRGPANRKQKEHSYGHSELASTRSRSNRTSHLVKPELKAIIHPEFQWGLCPINLCHSWLTLFVPKQISTILGIRNHNIYVNLYTHKCYHSLGSRYYW